MAALLQGGPLIAYVDTTEEWQFREQGILRANTFRSQAATSKHLVLITGYNFESPVPYYIVKNSWGSDWREGGYAYLEAGANTSGIGQCLVSVCTDGCDKIKPPNDFLVDRTVRQLGKRNPARKI